MGGWERVCFCSNGIKRLTRIQGFEHHAVGINSRCLNGLRFAPTLSQSCQCTYRTTRPFRRRRPIQIFDASGHRQCVGSGWHCMRHCAATLMPCAVLGEGLIVRPSSNRAIGFGDPLTVCESFLLACRCFRTRIAALWQLCAGDLRVCRNSVPVRQPAYSCHPFVWRR